MLNPVAMSIIATTFTEPAGRARAVGAWGAVAGLSLASGPVLGGLLVSGLGWRSIFWINVPIGVLAIYLTQRFVPESKAARGKRFDPLGQLFVVTLLGPLTAAVIEGPGTAGAHRSSSRCSPWPPPLRLDWLGWSAGGPSRWWTSASSAARRSPERRLSRWSLL